MRRAALALVVSCLPACGGSDDSAGKGGAGGSAGAAGTGGRGGSSGSAGAGGNAASGGAALDYPRDDVLRLNHLQTKGTHNSYHVASDLPVPDWAYTHAPLDVQLEEQGVRKFELDTYFDAASSVFQVHHVPTLDMKSTCPLLAECLGLVRAWSDAHRAHHPIFIQIEPKDTLPADSEPYFAALEAEILSVWPRDRIVAPDDVKGAHSTLREAVTTTGWPTLGATRGKVLFFVNESGPWREAYTRGQTNLDGRLLFAEADADDPYAAVLILNDPQGDAQAIRDAVAAGFVVRTRADGVPLSADPMPKAQAALASGAQVISTDWPVAVDGVSYVFEVPDGSPSRCNPVSAPAECTSKDVEDPGQL